MLRAEGTHSSALWPHTGRTPSAARMPTATSIRFMVCPRSRWMRRFGRRLEKGPARWALLPGSSGLEGCPQSKGKEAHLIQRHVRHLPELRAGRVQGRAGPLLAVEDVLGINPQ